MRTDEWRDQADPGPDWDENAACKGMDQTIFFPSGYGWGPEPAFAVCAGCPIKNACRDLGENEVGVWGGEIHGWKPQPRRTPAPKRRFRCDQCGVEFTRDRIDGKPPKRCSDACVRTYRTKHQRAARAQRRLTLVAS